MLSDLDKAKQLRPQPLPAFVFRPQRVANLKISYIEVIQAVQRQAVVHPGVNGGPEVVVYIPVPLVARKRTMARVYVASTVPGGVAATGILWLSTISNGFPLMVSAGPPINADQLVLARPSDEINRNDLTATLNFVLPVSLLNGNVTLFAQVYRQEGPDFGAEFDQSSITADFYERRMPLKFVHMLIHNVAAAAPKTIGDYYQELDRVIACYPAPDDSFFPLFHLPGFESIENNSNLTIETGWPELFSQVEQIMSGFNMDGFVLTGLLALGATPYAGLEGIPILFEDAGSFAHELGHKFGLGHSAAAGIPPLDPRIPTVTDEPGLDMSSTTLIPPGSSEMMNPLASSPWWVSTATWQILFDEFK